MPDWVWITAAAVFLLVVMYFGIRSDSDAASPEPGPKRIDPEPEKETPRPSRASGGRIPAPAPKRASASATPAAAPAASGAAPLPKLDFEENEEVDPTRIGTAATKAVEAPTKKILYDEDAAQDEPTHSGALILVTATAQTDRGLRRKRNEDSVLVMDSHGVFVVADGMGGYSGGEVASALAVKTIQKAFETGVFPGPAHETLPKRASELARAIHSANHAILEEAQKNEQLQGMGTTICAARFSPNKQRLYVGHVGDSRMYRVRDGVLKQMTSDHTMKDFGVTGAAAAHLSRAVGVWPSVPIDIMLGKPRPRDIYILCSDGLTKMVSDEEIASTVSASSTPEDAVSALVDRANANGGKDNITVIVIRVDDPARPGG
jgi:protein phosphatase